MYYLNSESKELTAILPNLDSISDLDEEIVSIKKQFQNTLETSKTGNTNIWKNQKGQLSVSMTPTRSFRHEKGNLCRQYQHIIKDSGDVYEYVGIACRNDFGRWIVPRR